MKNYIEIWEDIILWSMVWRLEIIEKDNNYTLSIYDKANNLITDIWYDDEELWEGYRNEFLEYLDNNKI